MGELTGHRGQTLAGQSQCENFPSAILVAVSLTGSNLRGSASVYSDLYMFLDIFAVSGLRVSGLRVSGLRFLKPALIDNTLIIKSDNQFLFISQS